MLSLVFLDILHVSTLEGIFGSFWQFLTIFFGKFDFFVLFKRPFTWP